MVVRNGDNNNFDNLNYFYTRYIFPENQNRNSGCYSSPPTKKNIKQKLKLPSDEYIRLTKLLKKQIDFLLLMT